MSNGSSQAELPAKNYCDRNGSPSTITNSGPLIARLDDSKDERA